VRVAFLGTPRIAVPALQSLVATGHTITLVITQPDRPLGRSAEPVPPAVKQEAITRELRVAQPRAVRTIEFLDLVRSSRSDVLVVVAYGRILPASVLGVAAHGAINVHFSLLPRYRGAAPVQWALARCERITGVTTMAMSEGMDEGDILLQREVSIEPEEHCPALQERLAGIGASLLVETLVRLERGDLQRHPQDHALATYAPRLRREDGDGDLSLPAREIEGRIRGFDPWPGVWVRADTRRLRLIRARAAADGTVCDEPPGRVLALAGGALRIACGGGSVLDVLAVQPEGGKVLSSRDAVNGRIVRPGVRLESTGAAWSDAGSRPEQDRGSE